MLTLEQPLETYVVILMSVQRETSTSEGERAKEREREREREKHVNQFVITCDATANLYVSGADVDRCEKNEPWYYEELLQATSEPLYRYWPRLLIGDTHIQHHAHIQHVHAQPHNATCHGRAPSVHVLAHACIACNATNVSLGFLT